MSYIVTISACIHCTYVIQQSSYSHQDAEPRLTPSFATILSFQTGLHSALHFMLPEILQHRRAFLGDNSTVTIAAKDLQTAGKHVCLVPNEHHVLLVTGFL